MDLFGWDLVSVMPVQEVNALLAANQGQLISMFSSSVGNDFMDVAGMLSNWRLEAGDEANKVSSNILLSADLVLQSVSGVPDAPSIPANYRITITTPLVFRPSDANKDIHNLHFDFKSDGTDVPAETIVSLTGIDNQALSELVKLALFNHYGQMSLIFASVNTVMQSDKFGALANPFFYYYTDANLQSYFIIAGSTDEHTVGQNPGDPSLCKGHPLIGLSAKLLLQYGIVPQVPAMVGASGNLMGTPTMGAGPEIQCQVRLFGEVGGGFPITNGEAGVVISIDDDKIKIATSCEDGNFHMPMESYLDPVNGTDVGFSFDWTFRNPVLYDQHSKALVIKPDPSPDNPPARLNMPVTSFSGLLLTSCARDRICGQIGQLGFGQLSIENIPVTWYGIDGMVLQNAGLSDNVFLEYACTKTD